MFLVKKKLANVRAPKTKEAIVRTTPTEGTIHINSNAADMLKININKVLSNDGLRAEIAVVGFADEAETQPVYGIWVLEEGTSEGCKLSCPSKKGGALQFNSATIWNAMGGNSETNQVYRLDADNNAVTEDENGLVSYADAVASGFLNEDGTYAETNEDAGQVEGEKATVVYILEFVEEKAKPVRKKGSDSSEEDEE